jgi:hypothetical protein
LSKQKDNTGRFILAGILTVVLIIMWVNNKNKAEESNKRSQVEVNIPSK